MDQMGVKALCITVAFVGLMGGNVLLLRQNRELTQAVREYHAQLVLQEGMRVPTLAGQTYRGDRLAVEYGRDRPKTVLLVYSPTCPVCEENWPNWSPLIKAAEHSRTRIIAVDLTGKSRADFLAAHGLNNVPVIASPSPEAILAYRFRYTPETIVISPEGKVERAWIGVLQDEAAKAIAGI